MKLRLEQLPQQLKHTPAPVYLLSGDEPVLMQQAVTMIRQALLSDAVEYQHIQINQGNWELFETTCSNQSLFSAERLIHVTLPTEKIGVAGSKTLVNYLQNPPTDMRLLITMPKLSAATRNAKWVKAIETAGVHVAIWPLNRAQTLTWLRQSMQRYELKLDTAGLELIFDATEGNLLAAQQELEKLSLHYGATRVSATQAAAAISQQSQFNLFELADTILTGDAQRISKMMHTMRQDYVEPSLILWAITREARMLASMSAQMQSTPLAELMRAHRIAPQRNQLIQRIMQNYSTQYLQQVLVAAYHIDTLIKGVNTGNIWQQLTRLALAFSPLLAPPTP